MTSTLDSDPSTVDWNSAFPSTSTTSPFPSSVNGVRSGGGGGGGGGLGSATNATNASSVRDPENATTLPSGLYTLSVGYPDTSCSRHRPPSIVQSTAASTPVPAALTRVAAALYGAFRLLQWPHQGA